MAGTGAARRPQARGLTVAFAAVVAAQAAHSVEEYAGRLWESFPPAAFLTSLFPPDRETAFIAINAALIAFGVWCLLWPVRREWPSAMSIAWGWVALETINGLGHTVWSLREGGYTPGLMTAPVLLVASVYLGSRLQPNQRAWSA